MPKLVSRALPVVDLLSGSQKTDTRGLQKLLINTDDEYTKPQSKEFWNKGERRALLSDLVTRTRCVERTRWSDRNAKRRKRMRKRRKRKRGGERWTRRGRERGKEGKREEARKRGNAETDFSL